MDFHCLLFSRTTLTTHDKDNSCFVCFYRKANCIGAYGGPTNYQKSEVFARERVRFRNAKEAGEKSIDEFIQSAMRMTRLAQCHLIIKCISRFFIASAFPLLAEFKYHSNALVKSCVTLTPMS